MSAHTPGPWAYQDGCSDTCRWEVVQPVVNGDTIAGEYGIEAEADARLIAAAPELLEALIKCAAQLEIITGMVHDERQALIAARAAIAKAQP